MRKPPFDKLEVRRAFAYAIDRQQVLDQVKFGLGKVAISPISSALGWAHNPNVVQYPHDVQKAGELLTAAGYPSQSSGPRLTVVFPHASMYAKIGEVVRQNLAEVGVDVNLQPLEFNTANDTVFVKQDFHLGMGGYCNGPDPEIGVTRAYVSSNILPIPFGNGAAYSNPQVDSLFAQAAATVDRPQRAALYGQIQYTLVREVPYWWLIEDQQLRAYRSDFHDLTIWRGNLAEQAWWDKAP